MHWTSAQSGMIYIQPNIQTSEVLRLVSQLRGTLSYQLCSTKKVQ